MNLRRGDRPLLIGHKGAAALEPENTLGSLSRAVELGCDLVEFDVLSLDGRSCSGIRRRSFRTSRRASTTRSRSSPRAGPARRST